MWGICGAPRVIFKSWDKGYAKEGKVGGSVLTNLDMQRGLEKYAGPGHWNDPDMLEVGNNGLTNEEERAHFSLWCIFAAPLIAGNDLSAMSKPIKKEILTNKEAIAIDQDPLGKQGYKIIDETDFEIFLKPLSDGDIAVCLFNRGEQSKAVTINWSDYKISGGFKIRDTWKHESAGTTTSRYTATIARHDVVLLRLSKK